LYGHDEILLGNEASADEANLLYLGHEINHQYSKSSAFEEKFREYTHSELFTKQSQVPHYYSRLRHLSELEITKQLSQFAAQKPLFKQVLSMLRSCNVGQQQGVWCHHCPKCAFVFAMFSAYLPPTFVGQQIFQKDLFADESLRTTFQELAGLSDKKPFECVGTFAEVRQAINLSIANYQKHQLAVPDQLFALQAAINQDEWLKTMADKSICILGMGREGQSTLAFLRHHFPDKKIAVADQNPQFSVNDPNLICHTGTNYLDHLADYQLIIKTAGIPATLDAIQQAVAAGAQLTSNSELFFAFCPSQHIIGVTGTKGKSTTSQLIYNILQQADLPSVLVGNIGQAALDKLSEITPQTRVVFELSCHQLDSLKVSPHIAVVLDIKSEHLDYYSDFAAYQKAKSSIARFQHPTDYIIYNPELEGASAIAKLSPAKVIVHSIEENDEALVYVSGEQIMLRQNGSAQVVIDAKDIPLLGQHNLYNVLPAVSVAALLNIPIVDIKAAIISFKTLAHRLDQIAEINGVRYIDDSIAVNPHAAIMAIRSFPQNSVLLIAGGYERQQDFSELVQVMVQMQVKQIFALPTTGQRLIETIRQQQAPLQIQAVDSLEQAVQLAKAQAVAGDVVLLSPASASFNDFKDYAMRGDHFAQLVQKGNGKNE
jgi:UDP-N-acetylmuramoylalanine--D-glutamate ligase